MPTAPIDTRAVHDRRSLHFPDFAAVRRDLVALESADREGTLRATGNWTPGQVFAHLAAFMEYPYDGYPAELRNPPLFIRLMLKLMRRKILGGGMRPGVKIPGIAGGTTGAEEMSTPDALARLRRAMDRMERSAPASPNPAFGPLSHAQWIQLNCRHAELHLGFLHSGA